MRRSPARWLRWQLSWRWTALRVAWFKLWTLKLHPSQAQRDYDSGDPVRRARVERLAADILASLKDEGDDQ